jgi:transglutaminase-like putative cysteine protease
VDDRTVEVVVRAVRPAGELAAETGAATFPAESQPADASCLEANHFISASDPRVVAMAAEVAAAESDPWTIAVTLERHVRQRMKQVDYSQAFLTAAETAEQLTGDCSEHAVLLAAVLRARNIPSRVAVGLVYVDAAAALGYHTWTEAWIGGRWVGLDATLADGGIAADHIKVAATSLERGLADPAIVALAQLLGAQPKITVVETRRRGH